MRKVGQSQTRPGLLVIVLPSKKEKNCGRLRRFNLKNRFIPEKIIDLEEQGLI
jgi:hypothetical protein